MTRSRHLLGHLYMAAFLIYMFVPLIIMAGAAFNDNRLPSVYPWKGFTWRWFQELFADTTLWVSFANTLWVAVAVVVIAVPIGTAAAILINSIAGKVRGFLYGVMVAPILMPGVVIGISTLLFWNSMGNVTGSDFILFNPGLHLSVLGQVSFIASFVMLLVLARLQSFDPGLEEAAMDLGASNSQVLRRILLPHLYPAIAAGAAIAFFQSIENFNTTLFTRGTQNTLTVYVFSKVRSGITPTINALALLMIIATLIAAIWYEVARRRKERRLAALERAQD
ncbi:MAG: ABC transporter permease [Rhodobacterales bacterium]|nr:ABC transporter permease [Rhodobacterales bacterium]